MATWNSENAGGCPVCKGLGVRPMTMDELEAFAASIQAEAQQQIEELRREMTNAKSEATEWRKGALSWRDKACVGGWSAEKINEFWKDRAETAEKQLAEVRIELEAAKQRGDEYKAALAEAQQQIERLRFRLFYYDDKFTAESHATSCTIWREDGQGHAEGFEGDRGPCNCGALINHWQRRAEAAEKQLAEARAHLFEFHHCNCDFGKPTAAALERAAEVK